MPFRNHPPTFAHTQVRRLRHWAVAVCVLILCLNTTARAQSRLIPMSGTSFIPRPTIPYRPAAKRLLAQTFNVGDQLTIPAYSFQLVGGGHYQTDVTCRLVGQNCYVFVENEEWGTRVTQAGVDSLARAFDSTTVRDPNRGIFALDTGLFGSVPDVDGDPRIIIAVIDILDSPSTGVTFLGFFDVANEAPPVSREIIYVDCNPLNVTTPIARATLAHELQHMIHWKADPKEAKWVDEGCSEYAELACGYRDTTAAATSDFLAYFPNTSLTQWQDQAYDFDQAYLWMTYFAQRYGESALPVLVANPDTSIAGINSTLKTLGAPENFEQLFGDWAGALYLDGPDNLGFRDIALGPAERDTVAVPTTDLARKASLWGVDYLQLNDAPGVDITVHSTGDNALLATLIANGDRPFVAPIAVPAGQTRHIHTVGSEKRTVALTSTSGAATGYTVSVAELTDSTSPAASDFDADGQVAFSDFLTFASGFGKRAGDPGFDPTLDLDNDRSVGFNDFLIFAQNFGKTP